nr:MAG TPA: hypothetical protein [Caudoviricetes sp.]
MYSFFSPPRDDSSICYLFNNLTQAFPIVNLI